MIVERLARGIAAMNGPMPGPRDGSSLSGSWVTMGNIPLVPSMGLRRDATYRMVYLTNPWVFSAVNKKASSIGRLPIHVYELDERGRKERVRGDSLDELLTRPTTGISRNAMIGGTVRDRLVYGNALWEIERAGGGGLPTGLKRTRWRDVARVLDDEDGRALGYELRTKDGLGRARRLLAGDVVHFGYGSDSESALGISPLEACKATLTLQDALVRHLVAYFANAMRPSGHIEVEKLTRERLKLIQESIEELYSSPENAGRVLVTSGKWQGISDTLEHGQIIELLKQSALEIATAYETPPPVLGILDHAIKSNVKELREQYGRDGIGPVASDFEQDIMAQLVEPVGAWSGMFVEFQLAEFLRPDIEARAIVYERLFRMGWTMDELRTLENMRPHDLAGVSDVPWVASGALPAPVAAQGRNPRPAAA